MLHRSKFLLFRFTNNLKLLQLFRSAFGFKKRKIVPFPHSLCVRENNNLHWPQLIEMLDKYFTDSRSTRSQTSLNIYKFSMLIF